MKKIICIFLSLMVFLSVPITIFSKDTSPWTTEYRRLIHENRDDEKTKYILADIDFDNYPELFVGSEKKVIVYTYKNDSVMKTFEGGSVSINYIENIKKAQNNTTNISSFIGQIADKDAILTYKLSFSSLVPSFELISEYKKDLSGTFYKDSPQNPEEIANCAEKTTEYLSSFSLKPFATSVLTYKEIAGAASKDDAIDSLFNRYALISSLSDDTASLSLDARDYIKNSVGDGSFLSFDKISYITENDVFVQFYVSDKKSDFHPDLPYIKKYAVVSMNDASSKKPTIYGHESEINTEALLALITSKNRASNIYIDFSNSTSFRGIDDYVNYLANIFSGTKEEINDNGKKLISEYMEYAVNRCSRTEIKAKNNTITVSAYYVSMIAENAVECMARLTTLCNSNNFTQIKNPRIIPEIICADIDFSKPIRIEYEKQLSEKLAGVSGIRLMLDATHGIYISSGDLASLEGSFDVFCMEYKKTNGGLSVVFTDKNNTPTDNLTSPVWFILPAESEYSTVMASFNGGTDNWGGQFDPKNKTIEFSTTYAGNYDILENDLTINDIDDLSAEEKQAIRFLVSKGIFKLDKRNNFMPNKVLSRYDFVTALVKMFYATNVDAKTTFTDVPKKSEFYRYVASAEELHLTDGFAGSKFRGNTAVSKEQVIALCGRTLVEKNEYTRLESDTDYLTFSDADTITDWAKDDVSIAVRSGIIAGGGKFLPKGSVTRAEGALFLYKTFMLLYDVSPITTVPSLIETDVPKDTEIVESYDIGFRVALCILASVFVVFVGYIINKIRKHRKKKNVM